MAESYEMNDYTSDCGINDTDENFFSDAHEETYSVDDSALIDVSNINMNFHTSMNRKRLARVITFGC